MSNLINPEDKFWSELQNGQVQLNNFRFRRFLEINNFFKHKPNEQSSFNIIQKKDIFLEIKDEVEVKDFVLDYVLNNNLGEQVYNLLTGKLTTFKRDFLSQISTLKIDTLKDTKDTCYLFYENGVVEIKKDNI